MVLLVDNYDSFVHNLARYLAELGCETDVVRNDAIDVETIRQRQPQAILLSPGPCTPRESGICPAIVRELGQEVPILGVCLGHQAIAYSLGADIVCAPEPIHGRTSSISHDGRSLFEGLPNPLTAMRYHSLMIDESTLPPELSVTARSTDGVIMAIEHREWPMMGVQFHPESVLTQGGHELLSNFLRRASIEAHIPTIHEFQLPTSDDDFFSREILRDHPSPGSLGLGG
ncbi:MAG: aminodeoxychorismate/anthranilate synthase component II [Planctomycetaceae bacterium]|nr:aminodeoxychorismate/anthranilate synthase component II [Planctomycetaceae bacterium]